MATKEFMVTLPHSNEECLAALDAVSAKGPEELSRWKWSCHAGVHTGYAFVSKTDQPAALDIVPPNIRSKATAIEVSTETLEGIKAYHMA